MIFYIRLITVRKFYMKYLKAPPSRSKDHIYQLDDTLWNILYRSQDILVFTDSDF